jgi:hypothetical protein
MDDDPVPEISICSAVREHYWKPIQGGKYAYGMDVFDYIHDTTPPQLFDVHDFPDPQQAGGFVNISCYVTDNVQVNTVKVNIHGPNGFTPLNATMNKDGDSLYYYNSTYTLEGSYHYSIWANDSSNNRNTSNTYNFSIKKPFVCGDANGDGFIDISDAVYLIQYIFGGGPVPNPLCSGDANGDSTVDISDAVYLIAYIFSGGSAPVSDCCG